MIKIFSTSPLLNNYETIFNDMKSQFDTLNERNFPIKYVFWGREDQLSKIDSSNIDIDLIKENNFRLYETPGMVALYDYAIQEKDAKYYVFFHAKGGGAIKHGKDLKRDERQLHVDKFFEIINNIESYDLLNSGKSFDVIGYQVNKLGPPYVEETRFHIVPNFWIAKVSHIKSLVRPTRENITKDVGFLIEKGRVSRGIGHHSEDVWRYGCENWIGYLEDTVIYSTKDSKYFCARDIK